MLSLRQCTVLGCNESPRRVATGVTHVKTLPLVSRLGPREREHHNLALSEACDVDLVAVHEDCSNLI